MKIFDLHCDTVYKFKNAGGLRKNPEAHLDLARMKEAGYSLETFAAFVDTGKCVQMCAWDVCVSLIEKIKSAVSGNDDLISLVTSADEIISNLERGRMSALLSVEEGDVICGDVSRVKTLAELGVRMSTFTWNYDNRLSCCAASGSDGGLTDAGFDFLSELEANGIAADVSHISDRGFFDVAEASKKPFLASHSNSREICGAARNLTDEMIKIIGERGGIIGLNYYSRFIGWDGGIGALMRHARHIADVGGTDVLALGSDFDGIEDNKWIPDATAVPKIADALLAAGFTSREADGILFGNAKRFLTEVL